MLLLKKAYISARVGGKKIEISRSRLKSRSCVRIGSPGRRTIRGGLGKKKKKEEEKSIDTIPFLKILKEDL